MFQALKHLSKARELLSKALKHKFKALEHKFPLGVGENPSRRKIFFFRVMIFFRIKFVPLHKL